MNSFFRLNGSDRIKLNQFLKHVVNFNHYGNMLYSLNGNEHGTFIHTATVEDPNDIESSRKRKKRYLFL